MADERIVPQTNEYIEILFHWHRYYSAARLAAGKTVIDLASGEGYGSHLLAGAAKSVLGIDISEGAVSAAQRKYIRPNLRYEVGTATRIPADDQSCDFFTSFETIEHMPEQDQLTFLGEIRRVLTPGGTLLISTPNKLRTDQFAEKNPYHIKEHYPADFLALLKTKFRYVAVYHQEVNLSSFIWKDGTPQAALPAHDYRLESGEDGYRPTEKPLQPYIYLIAHCSNEPLPDADLLASSCHEIHRKPIETVWGEVGTLSQQVMRLQDQLEVIQEENLALRGQNRLFADSVSEYHRKARELEGLNRSAFAFAFRGYQKLMDKSPLGVLLRPLRNLVKTSLKG